MCTIDIVCTCICSVMHTPFTIQSSCTSPVTSLISCHFVYVSPQCTDLAEGKGETGNYYSQIKEVEYDKMEDIAEYKEMDGEGQTRTNPNAQVDEENNAVYMDMRSNTQPQPLQTNQQPSSDEQPQVEVNKGAVVDNPEDQSQTYVNVEQEPEVKMSMTKNPAYMTFHH